MIRDTDFVAPTYSWLILLQGVAVSRPENTRIVIEGESRDLAAVTRTPTASANHVARMQIIVDYLDAHRGEEFRTFQLRASLPIRQCNMNAALIELRIQNRIAWRKTGQTFIYFSKEKLNDE